MNPDNIFLHTDLFVYVSVSVAGFIIGYAFTARLSAHISWKMMLLRMVITGGAFIQVLALVRWLEGAPYWESWLGVGLAYLLYSFAMSIGIRQYDQQYRARLEAALGRPVRGNAVRLLRIPDRRSPKKPPGQPPMT